MGPWILLSAYSNTKHRGRDHEGPSFRWFWDTRMALTFCHASLITLPSPPTLGQFHGLPRGDLCFPFSTPGFLSFWAAKALFPSSLGGFSKYGCYLWKGVLREWWPMAAKQIWAGWLVHEVPSILHGVAQNGTIIWPRIMGFCLLVEAVLNNKKKAFLTIIRSFSDLPLPLPDYRSLSGPQFPSR